MILKTKLVANEVYIDNFLSINFVSLIYKYIRKYFHKSIRIILATSLATSLFFNFLFLQNVRAQSDDEAQILPSMTVFAKRGPDNKLVETFEVEWHESNDPTIKKEFDGTYTAGHSTKPYALKSLISSLGSPAVNLDIRYAKNSVSLTADGSSALTKLIDALSSLDEGTSVRLTPINKPDQVNKSITQRRFDSLKAALMQSLGIDLKIMPSKRFNPRDSKLKQANYWRIQVQREPRA